MGEVNKEKYPETIDKENWDNYNFEDFNDSDSYKEDYNNALKYQKKNGGEIYTMHDEENEVYYWKGLHYVNRLGFSVVTISGDEE